MEKQYSDPLFEVVMLPNSQIITASGDPLDPGPADKLPDVDFEALLNETNSLQP